MENKKLKQELKERPSLKKGDFIQEISIPGGQG
jgi:hypothetical protein